MIEPVSDPDWARLLAAARRSLERTGGSLEGVVTIAMPSDAERRLVIGITGVHRSTEAQRIAVRLSELDAYLEQTTGLGLVATFAAADGLPLRDRPAERRLEAAARAAALSLAQSSTRAGEAWFERWLATLRGDGTLTRIIRVGADLGAAVRVLEALPGTDEPMAVFAERVLNDTKALNDATLRALVVRAIAQWQEAEVPTTAEHERALWESVGVVPDDLASQVLVLNLPAGGGIVADWLNGAAQIGLPIRLTLQQLRLTPLAVCAPQLFVTENPAVLRAASALGASAPAMVCTEGMPSAAAHRLLACAPGAVLWWRNDFDWPGIRMLTLAQRRYVHSRPWRMSAADYLGACGEGPTLVGSPVPTPWDPPLAQTMARVGRAVMEERLLPVLLDDLRAGAEQY